LPTWHPLRVLATLPAMVGMRLDGSWRRAMLIFSGIVLSAMLSFQLTDTHLANLLETTDHRPRVGPAFAYLALTWFIYYVGHALFYRLGMNRLLRRRLGDDAAWLVYSSGLGVIYFNTIWCQIPFLSAFGDTLRLGATNQQVFWASLGLCVASLFTKFWATLHLGLDGYYYRDMFLEQRRDDGPIEGGPYAVFSDPMYSVGYLTIYGGALYAQSFEGLVVGLIFHVSIFAFNLVVERPFVQRMYVNPEPSPAT
jgi:hypothetical protein